MLGVCVLARSRYLSHFLSQSLFFKPRVAQRVGRRKGFRGGDAEQTGGVT